MNLTLSNTQQYISTVDFVRLQDWSIKDRSSRGFEYVYSKDNIFFPPPRNFTIFIKDVLLVSAINTTSTLKLKTTIKYHTSYVNWITIPELALLNFNISGRNLKRDFSVILNLLNAEEGVHNASVNFEIIRTIAGEGEIISSFKVDFKLLVLAAGNYFFPYSFSFVNPVQQSMIQFLTVTGNNWKIIASRGLFLEDAIEQPDGTSVLLGSGQREISVGITDHGDDGLSLINKLLSLTLYFDNKAYTIPITVLLFTDYYPKSLEFNNLSGLLDNPIQEIFFSETGNYSVQHPSWLNITKNEGTVRSLTVQVISPDNIGTGQYNGVISLYFPHVTHYIPVRLTSFEGFNLGLRNNEIVFSNSIEMLRFKTMNRETYVRIGLIVDNLNGSGEWGWNRWKEFTYKIPFVLGQAKFSLAEVLSRQLLNQGFDEYNYLKLDLSMFSIVVEEVNKATGLPLYSYKKNNILALPGHRPKLVSEIGILQHSTELERFSRLGVAVINVVSKKGSFDYLLRKNNEVIYQESNAIGSIRSIYITFHNYEAIEGDLFEFVLLTPNGELTQTFVIVPDSEYSTTIYYKNSYGLTSSIEFTGERKIESEIKKKNERYVENNVSKSRSFLDDSLEKLTINTGFLLDTQIKKVKELLLSTDAWFIQEDRRFKLVPTTEKLTTLNSEDFLQSFTLDFIINDTDYAQIRLK